MSTLKGKKQSPEHVAKRIEAIRNGAGWGHSAPPKYTPERLWDKVGMRGPDDCWPWLGGRNGENGYGRVEMSGKAYYAHRVIFSLCHPGKIHLEAPKDKSASGFIRHTCDNPICCNPAHLLIGTHAENMQDMSTRKRIKWANVASTETPRAKLGADDVRAIREQSAAGATRKELAERFGVSIQTIKAVRSGRHYSDVT
jgi:DNA-binding transcriptional regulator YiaG